MLLNPAEKYRKLIPLLSHAVRTATQISAYFGSLDQLISMMKNLIDDSYGWMKHDLEDHCC